MMWPKWVMALLVMLQEKWSARRDAQVRFLKLQVEILQSRLPGNRIIPDPVERRRLLKMGGDLVERAEPSSKDGKMSLVNESVSVCT